MTEKKVFVVNVDELDKQNPPRSLSVPTPSGQFNTQDFIGVPYPAGYTHIQMTSQHFPKDHPQLTAENPLSEKGTKNGGTWLCLRPSALKRVFDNPNDYVWVDSQPLPASNVPKEESK